MPELAEVEYYRTQWRKGLKQKVLSVHLHAGKRIFRGTDTGLLQKTLTGSTLSKSEAHGKQLLFRFTKGGWLGLHLGMTGKLRIEAADAVPHPHDHLVLRQRGRSLVFSDPRQFGRVLFHAGTRAPAWWADRPASLLSREFTLAAMAQFLARHARAPMKAVILLQSGFPGIGNWMADEILWQSKIHPRRLAGELRSAQCAKLHASVQHVSREALRTVGRTWGDLPEGWLFHHRWRHGGRCPRDNALLSRATIGGRTTCWCPKCQK